VNRQGRSARHLHRGERLRTVASAGWPRDSYRELRVAVPRSATGGFQFGSSIGLVDQVAPWPALAGPTRFDPLTYAS
jgi:hypothetical protein